MTALTWPAYSRQWARLASAFLVASCGGDTRVRDSASNCEVSSNSRFSDNGFTVTHKQPKRCPIYKSSQGYETYEVVVKGPMQRNPVDLLTQFYNQNSNPLEGMVASFFDDPVDPGKRRANLIGRWTAATVQVAFGGQAWDRAENQVFGPYSTDLGQARVFLPYFWSSVASVGPTSVSAGSVFTIIASVEGYDVPSYVDYQWFLAGVPISSASSEPGITTSNCEPGVYDYTVRATASTGAQEKIHRVYITAPDGSPHAECPY